MKRIISILTAAVLMLTFITGCGKSKRQLYSEKNLGKYIELNDYLGTQVDTQSEDFDRTYIKQLGSVISNSNIYDDELKQALTFETGEDLTVELGDMVNIDYKGYNGDTAFEGGTAEGALLLIGSQTFIDDFEDELIGAKVGDTVNVTATFPQNYGNSDLAGVDAVFVVKINSIAKTPEEIYNTLNFGSVDDFKEYLKKQSVYQVILDDLNAKVKVNDYPEKYQQIMQDAVIEYMVSRQNGVSADSLTDTDKKSIKENIVIPMLKVNMMMYYILDKENLKLDDEIIAKQQISQQVIAESYAVQEIVMEYLYGKAKIK